MRGENLSEIFGIVRLQMHETEVHFNGKCTGEKFMKYLKRIKELIKYVCLNRLFNHFFNECNISRNITRNNQLK